MKAFFDWFLFDKTWLNIPPAFWLIYLIGIYCIFITLKDLIKALKLKKDKESGKVPYLIQKKVFINLKLNPDSLRPVLNQELYKKIEKDFHLALTEEQQNVLTEKVLEKINLDFEVDIGSITVDLNDKTKPFVRQLQEKEQELILNLIKNK